MTTKAIQTNEEAAPKPVKLLAKANKRLMRATGRYEKAAKKARATRLAKLTTEQGTPRKRMPKKVPKPAAPRLLVTLYHRHVLSDKVYGPGILEVPEAVGRLLQETEDRIMRSEQRLREDRAFVVGRGNHVTEVHPDSFSDRLNNMMLGGGI